MKPQNKIRTFFNALFINPHHFSCIQRVEKVVKQMKYSEKIIFTIIALIFAISGITLLYRVNNMLLVEVPAFGGSFTEGVIGSPRFINPVLAISDTDKDLSSLIYSGLLKTSQDGKLEPDLAESYTINENGTVYDFTLKEDIYFHDGRKVTADDLIFTISRVLDSIIKSPKAPSWEGVLVEKTGEREVRFTLSKPYSPFLQALTLGILPKHVWEGVTSEEFPFSPFNIDPIGAGPYKIKKISRNSGGIPNVITLSSWKKYNPNQPKIKSITFKFFQNEEDLIKAYQEQDVKSVVGLSPSAIKTINPKPDIIKTSLLPRVFGVFFNQNNAQVFVNKEIREALAISAPKQKIVDNALLGFGKIINGPTPENLEEEINLEQNIETAKALLEKNNWKLNDDGILEKKTKTETVLFSFSISTSDTPELRRTAEILKETWEKLGASISIKVFEGADLSQNVIKPRKYDALLFGEVIGPESDLLPFWHSSERNDPGLNISLYANITVDKTLEDIQKETDLEIQALKKEEVVSEIKKDIPAIFLFSPYFLYLKAPEVKNIAFKKVSSQNERFVFIDEWFIETNKIWKFFVKD